MTEHQVWVFLYGSYMSVDVQLEVGVVPSRWEVGRLGGFDIRIEPRANLYRSDRHCVYGIAATLTHQDLDRLYAHARDVLGETYLPEAVLIDRPDGGCRPVLCYIAHDMKPSPPESDYVERIVRAATGFGFPAWYIERLESFRR